LSVEITGRDAKAIRESRAEPAELVDAFEAARHGEWGSKFVRETLAFWAIAQDLNGYRAFRAKQSGTTPPRNYNGAWQQQSHTALQQEVQARVRELEAAGQPVPSLIEVQRQVLAERREARQARAGGGE
jgi:hypothetical protein